MKKYDDKDEEFFCGLIRSEYIPQEWICVLEDRSVGIINWYKSETWERKNMSEISETI